VTSAVNEFSMWSGQRNSVLAPLSLHGIPSLLNLLRRFAMLFLAHVNLTRSFGGRIRPRIDPTDSSEGAPGGVPMQASPAGTAVRWSTACESGKPFQKCAAGANCFSFRHATLKPLHSRPRRNAELPLTVVRARIHETRDSSQCDPPRNQGRDHGGRPAS
jgi:hypothetical protein